MVDITPAIPNNRNMIDSYGDGGFRVLGERIEGDLIVGLTKVENWDDPALDNAGVTRLINLLENFPDPVEVLLIGCGNDVQFLPEPHRQMFRNAGISVDLMNTSAACRTFNVLMTEERRAAVALIAVEK
ncbi:MAG: Mth938-like domain-containing protein [Alphaproteobacteria bacterium]